MRNPQICNRNGLIWKGIILSIAFYDLHKSSVVVNAQSGLRTMKTSVDVTFDERLNLAKNDDYWKVFGSAHEKSYSNSNFDKIDENSMDNINERSDSEADTELNSIEQLHQPNDVNVRATIDELERSMYRSQKGHRPNPNHIVPYHNHPFEHKDTILESTQYQDHDRNLQGIQVKNSFKGEEEYGNIRITSMFEAMDTMQNMQNFHEIDFIENEVIPKAIKFWSSALKVIPVSETLILERTELSEDQFCGDEELSPVPSSHMTSGISNTDLALYVSASSSSRFCSSSTLVLAIACNFDQYDRPTAGAINFCIDQVKVDDEGFSTKLFTDEIVGATIYEIGHILGISSNSFPFFYDSISGLPRTHRPVQRREITCVDGSTRFGLIPSENTLQFFSDMNSQRYAAIVTPKVITVARNHFNCQSLMGVPLENQPQSSSCTGDQWEQRLFYPESLGDVNLPNSGILSPLSLALLEDSGWYIADYAVAQVSTWGHGAGCDFVNGKCLQTSSDGMPVVPDYARGYFCNKFKERGCSSTHTHKLACTMIDYSLKFPFSPIPTNYQYFPMQSKKGGPKQADYCPVYGFAFKDSDIDELDCRTPLQHIGGSLITEYRGEDARCFETTLEESKCYKSRCVRREGVLKVQIQGVWATCENDFQQLSIFNKKGDVIAKMTCPRLSSICPDLFCPANCSGRGVCDYEAQFNGVTKPRCKCFDPRDLSIACSSTVRLIDDPIYAQDPNDFFDIKITANATEKSSIDTLIDVFRVAPSEWTRRSRIWLGGIVTFFMIMTFCAVATCFPSCTKKMKCRRGKNNQEKKELGVSDSFKEKALDLKRYKQWREYSLRKEMEMEEQIELEIIGTMQDIVEKKRKTRRASQDSRKMRKSMHSQNVHAKQQRKSQIDRQAKRASMINSERRGDRLSKKDSYRRSRRVSDRSSMRVSMRGSTGTSSLKEWERAEPEKIETPNPPTRKLSFLVQGQQQQQRFMMLQLEQEQSQKQKRMESLKKRQDSKKEEDTDAKKEVDAKPLKKLKTKKPAFGARSKQFGI